MKKIRKKKALYREPDAGLIELVQWVMKSALSFGSGVKAEFNVNRRRSPYIGYTVMAVTQKGYFWWRGFHFRLSKDGKKVIRLNLYHRKMFLEMRKLDDLFIRDLQDELRRRKEARK